MFPCWSSGSGQSRPPAAASLQATRRRRCSFTVAPFEHSLTGAVFDLRSVPLKSRGRPVIKSADSTSAVTGQPRNRSYFSSTFCHKHPYKGEHGGDQVIGIQSLLYVLKVTSMESGHLICTMDVFQICWIIYQKKKNPSE